MAVVDVGIVISARDNASGTIRKVQQQLNGLSGGFGRAGAGARGLGGGMLGMASRFNTAAAAIFITYQSLKTLVGGMVGVITEAAQMQTLLITTTGSARAAAEEYGRLNDRFAATTFAVQDVAQGFAQLRGAGLSVADANRTLEATGAAVAAFGGGQEQFNRAVLALTQVASKGVAAMEELRGQLSEAVPGALRIMAREAGISVPEFMQRVRQGLVSSEEAIRLFTEGAERTFGDFLENLKNTVPGAVNEFANSFQRGVASVFSRTDIGDRMIVIFQNLTEMVDNFFASIDQEEVDAFFLGLQEIGQAAVGLGKAFGFVAEVLGPFIELIVHLLGLIGKGIELISEWATEGWPEWSDSARTSIGAVLNPLGALWSLLKNDINPALRELEGGNDRSGDNPFNVTDADLERVRQGRAHLEGIQAEIAAILGADPQGDRMPPNRHAVQRARQLNELLDTTREKLAATDLPFLDDFQRVMNNLREITGSTLPSATSIMQAFALHANGMSRDAIIALSKSYQISRNVSETIAEIRANALGTMIEQADRFAEQLRRSFREVQVAQLDAFSELTGGTVAAAVARVNLEYDGQVARLREQLRQAEELNQVTGQHQGLVDEINAALTESERLRRLEVAHATALANETIRARNAQYDLMAIQLQQQAREINRANAGPLTQIGLGTQAGQTIQRVEQERVRIQQEIESLRAQQAELQAAAQNATGEMLDKINAALAANDAVIQAQQNGLSKMTEAAVLSRDLWQQVGQTIEQSVGNAIYGLITGTQSLKDVGLQMFQALTQAAINYIVQLIIIKTLKQAAMFGFADGGVFGGPITKMANGGTNMSGIIRGPTMFMAGEAGEEAIMPLERIGGKLGVRTTGGGGDNYHISISAIDTQTGAKFLMDNMDSIVYGLRKKNQMNRGVGRVTP